MKKINLDQAEEIIRKKFGHTYAYHQLKMYVMGYNDAVKKHNAKRKKRNLSESIKGTVKPGECDTSAQKHNKTMNLAFEMFKTAIDGLTEIRIKHENE
jgi:hypothetical protein